MRMIYQERKHRLPADHYIGRVCVAFTLCIEAGARPFTQTRVVDVCTAFMSEAFTKYRCVCPAYVFMPDHQHVIATGLDDDADTWRAMVLYKQKSGFWFSRHMPDTQWQKDFYDHILRTEIEILPHVRYILENPVRNGLVDSWEQYPFKGSIGCELSDVLTGMYLVGREKRH
jgi:REP element-mobilizing transposase RayT